MDSYEMRSVYPTVAGQSHEEDNKCKNGVSVSKKVMASHGIMQEQEEVGLLSVVSAQEHQISVLSRQLAFLRLGFKRAHGVGDFPSSHFDFIVTGQIFESETSTKTFTRAVHRGVLAAKSAVLRSQLEAGKTGNPRTLQLPTLRFRELRDKSVKDNDVFDAFIDYLYLATIPGLRLRLMWRDLLQLATDLEITTLKEDCEQFMEHNLFINRCNILEILEVGWLCTSAAVLRCALTKSFEDPKAPLISLSDAAYKDLADAFPDLNDRVVYAEEAAKSRRGIISTGYSKAVTKDPVTVDSTSLFLQIVTLCSGGRNFFSGKPKRRVYQ